MHALHHGGAIHFNVFARCMGNVSAEGESERSKKNKSRQRKLHPSILCLVRRVEQLTANRNIHQKRPL